MMYGSSFAELGFMDAFYFCFISASSIGLGDFSPADYSANSFMMTIIYLIFALTFVALLLNLLGNGLEDSMSSEESTPNQPETAFPATSSPQKEPAQVEKPAPSP